MSQGSYSRTLHWFSSKAKRVLLFSSPAQLLWTYANQMGAVDLPCYTYHSYRNSPYSYPSISFLNHQCPDIQSAHRRPPSPDIHANACSPDASRSPKKRRALHHPPRKNAALGTAVVLSFMDTIVARGDVEGEAELNPPRITSSCGAETLGGELLRHTLSQYPCGRILLNGEVLVQAIM